MHQLVKKTLIDALCICEKRLSLFVTCSWPENIRRTLVSVNVCVRLFAACGICDFQHSGRSRSSQAGPTGACHTNLAQRYCSQLEQIITYEGSETLY
jgi:hypothetical protein